MTVAITPEILSAIAAFAAANLGKLNAPSKTTAVKSLAEVTRVLKGNMVSIEVAEWISEALVSELGDEVGKCQDVKAPGRDPIGYLPNLALTHPQVMAIKNEIFALWDDPETCGDEFGLLPDRKVVAGKAAKAGGAKWELATVTGNATLTQSLAIVAQYTRQYDVSLTVSHGTVAVKHGSKTMGLLGADMKAIDCATPDGKITAGNVKAESNRAKLLWQMERYTLLTRSVQKTVAGKWASLIFDTDPKAQPVKCAALARQCPASMKLDLKAALLAVGVSDPSVMQLLDK